MKKYLIHYTNTISQDLGESGDVLLTECEKFPTTEWLRNSKKISYIGGLLILSITEVPSDWE
jgi:hypothetical protein